MHLFLLDQKVWLKVQYSVKSDRLSSICNAAISVVCDGSFEKVIIFGGMQHDVTEDQLSSVLTNRTYIIEVSQRKIQEEENKSQKKVKKAVYNPALIY